MAANPAGFVQLNDFGAPMNMSAVAREVISGGQFVFISGTADVVSSGARSFTGGNQLPVVLGASGLLFNGIALQNVASGADVAFAMQGVFLLRADGTVTAGKTLICAGADSVRDGTTAGIVVGRALTTATSGLYCLALIRA